MKIKKAKFKRGFTLIELLIVIAIIGILASVILVNINLSRKNARVNGTKTSIKTTFPAIIACKDGGGTVSAPVANTDICTTAVGLTGTKWPTLSTGHLYGVGVYDSTSCSFTISTNGDSADLTCSCATQNCT